MAMASSPGAGTPASATIVESPAASSGENFLPRQLCEPGPMVHAFAPPNWSLTNPANVPFTAGAGVGIGQSPGPGPCRRGQARPHTPYRGRTPQRRARAEKNTGPAPDPREGG